MASHKQDGGPKNRVLTLKDAFEDDADFTFDSAMAEGGSGDFECEVEIPGASFKIPKVVLNALHKSKKAVYWSHTFYRNNNGEPIKVSYAQNLQESEILAQRFLYEKVLGFDMEWKSTGNSRGIKENISLIQVASENEIALFHIARHAGSTVRQLLAPTLKRIIEAPYIAKTGVAILNADGARLKKYMGLKPQGFFELSHLYRLIQYCETDPSQCNKKLVGLSAQVQDHLGFPLFKGEVRTSDWTKALNEEQKLYAASDAYAGYLLYRCMDAKRVKMANPPPLPEFAEKYLPIRLPQVPVDGDAESGEEVDVSAEEEDEDTSADFDLSSATKQNPPSLERSHLVVPRKKRKDPARDLDALGQAIFHALCMNRYVVARRKGIKPYSAIASNVVFARIASARPTDLEGLRLVQGVGPLRFELYGEEWLEIVSRHLALDTTTSRAGPHESPAEVATQSPQQTHRPQFRVPPALLKAPSFSWTTTSPMPAPPRPESTAQHRPPINLSSSPAFEPLPPITKYVPPSASTSLLPNPQQKVLYTALSTLRSNLSTLTNLPIDDLSTDSTLHAVATRQPSTIGEICKIPGAGKLFLTAKNNGVDLLDFLKSNSRSLETLVDTKNVSSTPDISKGVSSNRIPLNEIHDALGAGNGKGNRVDAGLMTITPLKENREVEGSCLVDLTIGDCCDDDDDDLAGFVVEDVSWSEISDVEIG